MKVTQCLWFEKDMETALRHYVSLIPGSSLDWGSVLAADSPGGPEGSVKISGFTLGDQRYMAFQAARPDPFNHSFSITVECETQAEVDRYWKKLSAGGKQVACGWLQDKFGLSWQITPTILMKLIADKDADKVNRVMTAMMQMVKLDIKKLKAAAKGK